MRSRREFLTDIASVGTGLSPALAYYLQGRAEAADLAASQAVRKGTAQHVTILHTADIHAQLDVHDEFFYEGGKPTFKRRGGFATLRAMIDALRRQNAQHTLVVDGGDCLQGSAVAALSRGQAIVPLINTIRYDLMLPGNWEVVYGKEMLIDDMSRYTAAKVCANMFHADAPNGLMFPPYQVFELGATRIGFVGYNDPLTPTRQSPAYSRGITFTRPEADLEKYVSILRREKGCHVVFVLSHMGLAQQLFLADQPYASGVDYILGADTHERIRKPLQGKYCKVTEPGAFASFVGKLDLIVENGAIKEETYALLDVDPDRYREDSQMKAQVAAARAPYRREISKVIGKTRTPLLRYYVIETPMDNLITDALMWKFDAADFVVSNGFRFCPPLVPPEGGEADITIDYLWSMLPVESVLKTGVVTGVQLSDWLENELENAFAKDPRQRFGGWFVRYKGLFVRFTVGNQVGQRVQQVTVRGEPLVGDKRYTVLGCEREGDPDNTVCRIVSVADPRRLDVTVHQVVAEYLALHSPVAPTLEGRAVATDAPADLLSQVEGTSYQFR